MRRLPTAVLLAATPFAFAGSAQVASAPIFASAYSQLLQGGANQ
jgi:hypothetical protein